MALSHKRILRKSTVDTMDQDMNCIDIISLQVISIASIKIVGTN